eukprot:40573_1
MNVVFYVFLLGISSAINCRFQTPSLHWEQEKGLVKKFDFNGWSWRNFLPCGTLQTTSLYSCSSTKFDGSYVTPALNVDVWPWKQELSNATFMSDKKNCALNSICQNLAGGVNGCHYALYSYETWRPTSCDSENDFDAITQQFDAKASLSCCDGADYCNEATTAFDECTEDVKFGDYVEDLYVCWNNVKRDFMSQLLCDENGNREWNALGWSKNCTEDDGSWIPAKRTDPNCRYRPRCTEELRTVLTTFGECACTAATDNNQTGGFIGTVMETMWQQFCPTIELSCAADGVVELWYKFWLVRYRIKVALARAAITDAILGAIKAKVAEELNVDPLDIEVTVDDAGGRRLLANEVEILITSTAEDETTGTYLETNMDDALATAIGTVIGAQTTKQDVSTEEGGDVTEGSISTVLETTQNVHETTETVRATTETVRETTDNGETTEKSVKEQDSSKASHLMFSVWCVVATVVLFKM